MTKFKVFRRVRNSLDVVEAASPREAWESIAGVDKTVRVVQEGSGFTIYPSTRNVALGRILPIEF